MNEGVRAIRGGRRRENMTKAEEKAFLTPFFEKAAAGGILVVSEVHQALEAHLGRKVALASAYNLLHRQGWRKIAPDKRHPKTYVQARKTGKKLPDLLRQLDLLWPGEGKLRLMFQDEARFGRISDTRKCCCPKPTRPLCQALVSQQYVYAYAVVSAADRELDSLILPYVNGTCTQMFIGEVSARHPDDRIVMDGAGWHQGLTPPDNLRLIKLPPYSPELNPVEQIWAEVREKYFHNHVFDSLEALETHLVLALHEMEHDHDRVHSITAWNWIVNALMN